MIIISSSYSVLVIMALVLLFWSGVVKYIFLILNIFYIFVVQ